MFNRKEIEKEKESISESCEECKHLVLKKDMQIVEISSSIGCGHSFYCPEHKKPYHKINLWSSIKYYGEVEMSKDGTPIGYKKIDKK